MTMTMPMPMLLMNDDDDAGDGDADDYGGVVIEIIASLMMHSDGCGDVPVIMQCVGHFSI